MKSFAILAIAFGVISSSTTYAKADMNEDQLNEYLQDHGYPIIVIQNLELEQKKDIVAQNGSYAGHYAESSYIGDGEITTQQLGTNFTHMISLSQVTAAAGKVDFLVNYNWDWNYGPTFTSDDQWGLAWTDDFDAYPSTAKYSYKTFGFSQSNPAIRAETAGNQITGYNTYTPGAGIGWSVNLIQAFQQNGTTFIVDRNKGWSQIKIGKAHNGSGKIDSSSIVGKYFHKYLAANGSLSFDKSGPSAGISYDWAYDSSNDYGYQWDWYHKNY
ncbi:hypothetical protein M3G15_06345 [Paenibacillus sp. p3-SID1389]|uniref:hypothetical protein n=1 Tax=Paenibacillus sp. p3-SID1389 TaxID=2916364 RepID=UPI0021A9273F|nr:hypothetical protein [Paenibacillus sp. p3-SID1389]MCT2194755.1 hypothetical protein [Paenibacillus sp. p3-SID1389]